MKLKALTATLALIAASSAMAGQAPSTCPDVSAFKNTGVTMPYYQNDTGTWLGVHMKDNYGTDNEWTFAIGEFQAQGPSDALAQANAAISTLSFLGGPEQFSQNMWMCLYQGKDQNTIAAAFTPAFEQIPPSFKRMFRR